MQFSWYNSQIFPCKIKALECARCVSTFGQLEKIRLHDDLVVQYVGKDQKQEQTSMFDILYSSILLAVVAKVMLLVAISTCISSSSKSHAASCNLNMHSIISSSSSTSHAASCNLILDYALIGSSNVLATFK
jgi:hypothetical protein